MAKRKRIRSLSNDELLMRSVSCVSVARTPSVAHVSVEVSPARQRESATSNACAETIDEEALIIRLIFSDQQGTITNRLELDDCFSIMHVSDALIDIHTLLSPVLENDVHIENTIWHLFSVMLAQTATLQVKLHDGGEDLIFSFSYETYESEAVVPLQEWSELFVPLDENEDDD